MSSVVQERRLLTLRETAARLNYSERNVRRFIECHGLPVLRLAGPGSALRIPADELETWLEQRSTSGGGSFVGTYSAMGRSSFVDDPAERDGTSQSSREAVEPARLAGPKTERESP
jgi:excisionase family DNA binding protein